MRKLLLIGGAAMVGLMLYALVVHQVYTWRGNTHPDSYIEWVGSRFALQEAIHTEWLIDSKQGLSAMLVEAPWFRSLYGQEWQVPGTKVLVFRGCKETIP